jgi:hypothetical protein
MTRALRRKSIKGAVSTARGKIVGGWGRLIRFRKQRLKPGYYVFAIRMSAEMNPARTTTLVGRAFRVGEPKKTSKPKRPS